MQRRSTLQQPQPPIATTITITTTCRAVLLAALWVTFCAFSARANERSRLSGVVSDAGTGERLPGASVLVKESATGVSTDREGRFTLTLSNGTASLVIRYVGYRSRTVVVELSGDREISVSLHPSTLFLQGVTASLRPEPEDQDLRVNSLVLDADHVARSTNLLPDALRSLSTLPGVTTNNAISAEYNVRGGNVDENLILLDRVELYQPYHLKEADFASLGIFNMGMIRSMEFSSGGFSARYGDRISSVVDITTRRGRVDRFGGSATVSLTHLDALAEGPLGRVGSFIITARRSYLTYVLRLLDYEETADPTFYDLQGKVSLDLSPSNWIHLSVLHAGDRYENNPGVFDTEGATGTVGPPGGEIEAASSATREERNLGKYYSTVLNLESVNLLSSSALLNVSASLYEQLDRRQYTTINTSNWNATASPEWLFLERTERVSEEEADAAAFDGRMSLSTRVLPAYEVRSGAEYRGLRLRNVLQETQVRSIEQNFASLVDPILPPENTAREATSTETEVSTYKASGYVENIVEVGQNVLVNLGARVDYFDLSREFRFSPRLSASLQLPDLVTLSAGWGVYHQFPNARQLAVLAPTDTNTQAERAIHYVLGLGRSFALGRDGRDVLNLRLEGFWKNYTSLIASKREYDGRIVYSRKNDARGWARGFDVSALLRMSWYYGWLSYEFLHAREYLIDGETYPRYTDQRHSLSFINTVELGRGWRANLRLTFGSGYAYAPATLETDPVTGEQSWVEGTHNTAYLPPYRRVDVRLERSLNLGAVALVVYLDVSNVLNTTNVFSYRYTYDGDGTPVIEPQELWPIIPSLGVTARF